jgi:hypothetical protein
LVGVGLVRKRRAKLREDQPSRLVELLDVRRHPRRFSSFVIFSSTASGPMRRSACAASLSPRLRLVRGCGWRTAPAWQGLRLGRDLPGFDDLDDPTTREPLDDPTTRGPDNDPIARGAFVENNSFTQND